MEDLIAENKALNTRIHVLTDRIFDMHDKILAKQEKIDEQLGEIRI